MIIIFQQAWGDIKNPHQAKELVRGANAFSNEKTFQRVTGTSGTVSSNSMTPAELKAAQNIIIEEQTALYKSQYLAEQVINKYIDSFSTECGINCTKVDQEKERLKDYTTLEKLRAFRANNEPDITGQDNFERALSEIENEPSIQIAAESYAKEQATLDAKGAVTLHEFIPGGEIAKLNMTPEIQRTDYVTLSTILGNQMAGVKSDLVAITPHLEELKRKGGGSLNPEALAQNQGRIKTPGTDVLVEEGPQIATIAKDPYTLEPEDVITGSQIPDEKLPENGGIVLTAYHRAKKEHGESKSEVKNPSGATNQTGVPNSTEMNIHIKAQGTSVAPVNLSVGGGPTTNNNTAGVTINNENNNLALSGARATSNSSLGITGGSTNQGMRPVIKKESTPPITVIAKEGGAVLIADGKIITGNGTDGSQSTTGNNNKSTHTFVSGSGSQVIGNNNGSVSIDNSRIQSTNTTHYTLPEKSFIDKVFGGFWGFDSK